LPLDGSSADGAARLVSRGGAEPQAGDDLTGQSAAVTGPGRARSAEPVHDAAAAHQTTGTRPAEPFDPAADRSDFGRTVPGATEGEEAARGPDAGPRRSQRLLGLDADDGAALGLWAAAHAALFVLAWAAAWAFRTSLEHAPLTGGFERWDAILLRNVAQYGYFGQHSTANNIAFFPGYPITLAAAHLILRNWVASELVVSAVAGCFAVVSLARLANGRRAVLFLLATPAAVFLMLGYTEALFLALAIPAWRAATRGRWWRAALLAGLSGLVRPDALFLIPALVIFALVHPAGTDVGQEPRRAVRSRLACATAMCCAFAGPAAYEIYLKVSTGSWLAWSRAMQAGWDLHLTDPVQALKTTWWAAFKHAFGAGTAFEFQLELGAMAVIVLVTIAFASRQRWPEAVYCGLAAVALGTSTWYQGCPRTLLVLFPIFVALAQLASRRAWITYVYLSISAPLAVVLAMMFLSGQWAG
jgi:Mannosyltransferase (PIG-V)